MPARYIRDVRARAKRLLDDRALAFPRPSTTATRTAQHFQASHRGLPVAASFETNFVIKHVSYPHVSFADTLIADFVQLRNVGVFWRLPSRGLDRRFMETLLQGDWIKGRDNLIITGPTGTGKSWLSCAIGHKACRDNMSVLYVRLGKLLDELSVARGDGRIAARLKSLARVDLLILDDWGLEPLNASARHHLLEILEDRYGNRSTLVTSQLPIATWHAVIGDNTYADAILDRLVHNAHRITLEGESQRRQRTKIA